MKDIKELALRVAKEMDAEYPRQDWTKALWDADFATRLIAAYTEGQEPVAYKYISTTYPDRFYQISELTPEYFSRENWTPVPLYAAPPEPAPSEFSAEQRDKDWSAIKSTAPSSGEVREMVERLRDIIYVNPNDAADMIERLAARVPDDRIATLEKQRDELLVALELCKFDSLNMSLEDLGFIRSVVAKVKP